MDFEEKLIEEVRQNECMYNMSLESYKDVMLKAKVWEEISGRLDVPDYVCRKRWKSLRDTYKRNKMRLMYGAEDVKIWWKYFKQLSFLDNCASSRVPPEDRNIVPVVADDDKSSSAENKTEGVEEQYTTVLGAVSRSIEQLNCVLEEHRAERDSSTAQFMIALGNRIERSGLLEEEKAGLEKRTINFVLSKIMEIKNKRA